MLAAFIMAGGSGERFWLLSTKEKPKQLLKLIDPERRMIRMTVDRIRPLIPAVRSVKKNKSIVTLGIKPTKHETGYGYIETV